MLLLRTAVITSHFDYIESREQCILNLYVFRVIQLLYRRGAITNVITVTVITVI